MLATTKDKTLSLKEAIRQIREQLGKDSIIKLKGNEILLSQPTSSEQE
ncbi:hypothetical protein U8V72_19850 [Priestia filamentosa]